MTKHQIENKISNIEEHIFWNLVDLISLGICYVVHRSIKFTLQDMHIQNSPEDMSENTDKDENSTNEFSIIFNKSLFNNVNHSTLKNSLFVHDQFDIRNYQCICLSCKRNISASRFAPHLEKCLGMGRNSSRIATKKIKQSLYLEDTNINDDNYENTFYFNSQDFENSSSSSISNSGDRSKIKKFPKKKKSITDTPNINSHIMKKEQNFVNLDLDTNQTLFEKETEKLVYFPSFKQSSISTQSHISIPTSQKDFFIKNIFDIEVGDYVALNLRYIIDHINSSNTSPSLSYLNFVKIFDMPRADDIFSHYSNLEFINHVNQFTLYSSRWLGLIEKLIINNLNEKRICVRWIKLASKECNSLNQHLYWEPEDNLSTDGIFSPSFPIPNVYFPNVIVNYNAIGALFNFDISKPMPAKLLHLLKYMSLAPQMCA